MLEVDLQQVAKDREEFIKRIGADLIRKVEVAMMDLCNELNIAKLPADLTKTIYVSLTNALISSLIDSYCRVFNEDFSEVNKRIFKINEKIKKMREKK